jgi:hypothetical protein
MDNQAILPPTVNQSLLPLTVSKYPPVETGGIAVFRYCPSACGGCFHPPVETGGIKIGRIKSRFYTQTSLPSTTISMLRFYIYPVGPKKT